ncbi:hypothetical protein FRC04_007644 [Tulasnella sp. 424]|nr:hypothetical protein FRC04_007644 [Tulasnella sp. 424]KAG8979076.1 hypothetical protein FRC05_009286 [Tulasnella sp. 425]
MLQRGPKLVELELRNVVIGRGDGFGSMPPVSMPHLKRLALQSLERQHALMESMTLDPIIASFFAPQLHTLRLDVNASAQDLGHPLQQGEIDANVFQRFPHISHVNLSDDRTEKHFQARRVLELLADPSTGRLLDKLGALTFSTMIPTYEGWEKFFPAKKLRVCIDSVFEIAARKSMDTKNLQDREAAIEKLKAIVPVEICPIPKDDTWFSNRWRFGGDN